MRPKHVGANCITQKHCKIAGVKYYEYSKKKFETRSFIILYCLLYVRKKYHVLCNLN